MVVHKPNHSDHVYFYTQSLDQRHKMISDKITLLFFPPRIRDTHSKLCLNRIKMFQTNSNKHMMSQYENLLWRVDSPLT